MCTRPYIPYTNLQRVYQNYSHKIDQPQQNAAQWSPHDVDRSLVAPTALCCNLTLILSQPEHRFQAHLALFLTMPNSNISQ